jgi:putative peptidoglycan lipid II flippase
MKDARTPTLINAIMVGVRIPLLILCAGLDPELIIPGLAAATSISYLVGAIAGEIGCAPGTARWARNAPWSPWSR